MKPDREKRLRVLKKIAEHQQRGETPIVRELALSLGLAGQSSLHRMLEALVVEGFLMKAGGGRERRECRYTLSRQGRSLLHCNNMFGVPVLGSIPAGTLNEIFATCDEFLDVHNLVTTRPGDFFLKVTGDSMVGDGILNGDYVQIRPGLKIANGEIAAVQIESNGVFDSTLKHVYVEKQLVRLKASNPAYTDIILNGDRVNIVGGYRGLVRRI